MNIPPMLMSWHMPSRRGPSFTQNATEAWTSLLEYLRCSGTEPPSSARFSRMIEAGKVTPQRAKESPFHRIVSVEKRSCQERSTPIYDRWDHQSDRMAWRGAAG